MRLRIRYEYEGPIGISRQTFNVKGQDVRVVIHVEEFYFELVNSQGEALVSGGNTKNIAVLKRQAKRALKKLGYEFGDEDRKVSNAK